MAQEAFIVGVKLFVWFFLEILEGQRGFISCDCVPFNSPLFLLALSILSCLSGKWRGLRKLGNYCVRVKEEERIHPKIKKKKKPEGRDITFIKGNMDFTKTLPWI